MIFNIFSKTRMLRTRMLNDMKSNGIETLTEQMSLMFSDENVNSDELKRLEAKRAFFRNWKTTPVNWLIFVLARCELERIEKEIYKKTLSKNTTNKGT